MFRLGMEILDTYFAVQIYTLSNAVWLARPLVAVPTGSGFSNSSQFARRNAPRDLVYDLGLALGAWIYVRRGGGFAIWE